MKIAVASVDGVTISRHFGRSQCFLVFDIEGENIIDHSVRPNTYTRHAQGECDQQQSEHHEPHSHAQIVEALKDCDVVLCHGMGGRAAADLQKNGIQPFVIDRDLTPHEAVQRFLAGTLRPGSGYCRRHL